MELIEAKVDGLVGTICLDIPAKRNALSAGMVAGIAKALDDFRRGAGARRRPARAPRRQDLVLRA